MPFPLNQYKSFRFVSRSSGTGSSGLFGEGAFHTKAITPDGKQGSFPSRATQHETLLDVVQQETEKAGSGIPGHTDCIWHFSQENNIPHASQAFGLHQLFQVFK